MDREIWQQLLALESRDITERWFNSLHSRKLNARRAREINAACAQAREYFRNSDGADYSVRPLLTFYGVASLSRAVTLLLRPSGGEEGLSSGHGLQTIDWADTLSSNKSGGLRAIQRLKIRTCKGLFTDFIRETENRTPIHVSSSRVDWGITYDQVAIGHEITFLEVLERMPDLAQDFDQLAWEKKYAVVHQLGFTGADVFTARALETQFAPIAKAYEKCGYTIACAGEWCDISCPKDQFMQEPPLFMHSYLHKQFGSIPNLHIAAPFSDDARYSQLGVTYLASYFLGMLVRYFPTHWIALLRGARGDEIWPTINRLQQLVEHTFPELLMEFVYDLLQASKEAEQADSPH